jgi:ABC-type Mn2+/Zn2+ transport system permease subunit
VHALLLDPLEHEFVRRALLELVLLAAVFGPLGVWVLLFRQAYAAESLAHAALPGLVIASLAGFPLVLGAAGGMLAGAALIALAAREVRLGADTAVAVVITAFVGAGALLALSPEVPARLRELLFGDPLGIAGDDLAVAAVAAAGGLATLVALHRPLGLTAFDRTTAPALGARPALAEFAVLGVLALTVVAAVEAVGTLLVVALVIGPSAAALRLASRLRAAMLIAVALGVAAAVIGLWASYHLDVAAGASVALANVLVFVAALGPNPCSRRSPRRRGSATG